MGEPTRPAGVWVELRDGTRLPVTLAYEGQDHEGLDVWAAQTHTLRTHDLAGSTLHMRMLPARTRVYLRLAHGG